MDHEFKPYADIPELCVAELYTGETCNQPKEEHMSVMSDLDIELRAALKRFDKLNEAKWAFINEETDDGEDVPKSGYARYDEIVNDYNFDLAERGEVLADVVRKFLGKEV